MTPHDVLGIKPNSTAQDIKNAYRRLAMQHHPDRGGSNQKFQQIQQAYRELSAAPVINQVIHAQLDISLSDSIFGAVREFVINTPAGSIPLRLEIPAGINNHDLVLYQNLAPGLQLYVRFRIAPDNNWVKIDNDLHHTIDLDFWDLLLGCEITITTLTGAQIRVEIAANTEPSTRIRIRCGGTHGSIENLYLTIRARLPRLVPAELLTMIQRTRDAN